MAVGCSAYRYTEPHGDESLLLTLVRHLRDHVAAVEFFIVMAVKRENHTGTHDRRSAGAFEDAARTEQLFGAYLRYALRFRLRFNSFVREVDVAETVGRDLGLSDYRNVRIFPAVAAHDDARGDRRLAERECRRDFACFVAL